MAQSSELRDFGFVKLRRGEKLVGLIRYPYAFALITQIALRARRTHNGWNEYNLQIGEAFIGDYHTLGLTEQKYRTAKAQLQRWKLATFRATNKGSIATLLDESV